MKITKEQLKKIISEELAREGQLEEVFGISKNEPRKHSREERRAQMKARAGSRDNFEKKIKRTEKGLPRDREEAPEDTILEEQPLEEAFTRQHYVTIAKILKQYNASRGLVHELANMFAKDNPNFDFSRFLAAATTTEGSSSKSWERKLKDRFEAQAPDLNDPRR